jgi:signal transduction histidine kinase
MPQVSRLQQARSQADLEYLLEEIPQAIEQTLEGADNVSRIVKAMKGFSHPGSQTLQQTDLNQALESTLIVARNEWKYCADLVTHYDVELPLINCLPAELNQVFLNLIVNAAHAIADKVGSSGQKGTLTVRTGLDQEIVFVEIADSGTGIPVEIRDKVFDPFFTTKGVGKGTGQGLAISYGIIVKQHQGQISFSSEVGQGTTFRIELPRNLA